MKKIFSPIIILSLFLTLISFGCARNAVYPQHESKDLGYLGALFMWSELTGNCVTTARLVPVPGALYPSSVLALPRAVCLDRNIYYVGPDGTGTAADFAQAQLAADAANVGLSALIAEFTRVAGLPAGAEAGCTTSSGFFTALQGGGQPVGGDGTIVYARANGATPTKCVSLLTGDKGANVVFCISATERDNYKDNLRFSVLSDAKTDLAFATNYNAFIGALTAAKATNGFSDAVIANTNTIDREYAEVIFQSLHGNAYTFAHFAAAVLDTGNAASHEACASFFVKNYDDVKKQVARSQGISASYDISLEYVLNNVTSPVVYNLYTVGVAPAVTVVGQGLLCCRDGVVPGICAGGAITQLPVVPTAAACGGSTNLPALW